VLRCPWRRLRATGRLARRCRACGCMLCGSRCRHDGGGAGQAGRTKQSGGQASNARTLTRYHGRSQRGGARSGAQASVAADTATSLGAGDDVVLNPEAAGAAAADDADADAAPSSFTAASAPAAALPLMTLWHAS